MPLQQHGCRRQRLPTRVWARAALVPPMCRRPAAMAAAHKVCFFKLVVSFNALACREAFQSYIAEDAFFLKSFGELLAAGWQAAGGRWALGVAK